MTPFNHILVPVDFSEPAQRALDLALTLASKFESKVTLLHASWTPPSAYMAYGEGIYWPTAEMEQAAQRELDALASRAKAQHPRTESALIAGEPWQMILEAAKARGCDLIVMGTHGRRGLSRVFLGSVAEKVVRLSPVPVMTVSGKAEQAAKEKVLAEATREKK